MTLSKAERVRVHQAQDEADKVVEAFDTALNGEKQGKPKKPMPKDVSGVSGAKLKSFVERIERLEEEKKALGEDIRDVYAESKGMGFEPKIIRKLVALRRANAEKRREEADLLGLYAAAIGMEV